jgi:hypothetical protein
MQIFSPQESYSVVYIAFLESDLGRLWYYIMRGKENKRVEFGSKINMLRVEGISVVERFGFNSFNETTSFQSACTKYDTVTGKCQQIGADAIYATNRNRRFTTHYLLCSKR